MEDIAVGPRTDWLLSFVRACQALPRGPVHNDTPAEQRQHLEMRLRNLPRPPGALEEFVGRCVLAETLLGEHEFDSGRRSRAVRRRIVEYCLGSSDGTRPRSDWSNCTELMGLVRVVSSAAHPVDEVSLAAEVRRFIAEDYKESLTDSRVVSAVGASRSEAVRAFKRTYGQSVREFVSDLRFAQAEQLLRSSELKISAVAAEVGYRSPKDLYRLIKTRTGLTPAQLRHVERDPLASSSREKQ
jgi:AraC-like DNA-binding protein